jgi:Flp pilus assembly protein TadG
MKHHQKARQETGSGTVEVLLMTPVLLLFLLFAVYVGRMAVMDHTVRRAAHDAARAATLELDADAATVAAQQVLRDSLGADQLSRCDEPDIVTKSVVGFDDGGNDTGIVTVQLICRVSLDGLNGWFPDKEVNAFGYQPIDDYRSRAQQP